MQAQKDIDFDAGYWRARSSILWLQGQIEDARKAFETGYALALELPAAGAYDYTRSNFDALREALDEPSPALVEMLTAINSAEPDAEAPVSTNPVALED